MVVVSVTKKEHVETAEKILDRLYYTDPNWCGRDYKVVVGEFFCVDGADYLLGMTIFGAVRRAVDKQ